MPPTKTMPNRRAEKPSDGGMLKGIAMAGIPNPERLFRLRVAAGRCLRLFLSRRRTSLLKHGGERDPPIAKIEYPEPVEDRRVPA